MADPLATAEQLSARTGETYPEGTELARANAALADASALVRAEGSGSWTAANAPDVAVTIVLAAAARVMSNPDGYTSETYGSYSYSIGGQGGAGAATGVMLTDEERATLRRLVGDAAHTVRLYDHAYRAGRLR